MEFTHREIIDLAYAHQQLDGTKEGTYKFSAKIRYGLSKNLRILKARAGDIDKTRNAMIIQHSPLKNGKLDGGSLELQAFEKEWLEFLDAKEEISNIMKLALVDLQLDLNAIPVTALCGLGPLVVEDVV